MTKKTKKQRKAIKRGLVAIIIAVIIGIAYFGKFFPLNPIEHFAILTAWSTCGWMLPALAVLYGLCEIFIEGDL